MNLEEDISDANEKKGTLQADVDGGLDTDGLKAA
jgi:hypothetical protein